MSNSKGFTVTELLVSLALASFLILGTMSFFVYQSRYGLESSRSKSVRQSVDMALMMVKQDIAHAGIGLVGNSEDKSGTMAVKIVPNDSPVPDELYLSFGRHLSLDLNATPNVYKDEAFQDFSSVTSLKFDSDEFNKEGVIGALIWDNSGTIQTVDVTFNQSAEQFEWTVPVTLAVPAVSYKVTNGILYRNGVPIIGESRSVQVTDFQVSPYGNGYQVAIGFSYKYGKETGGAGTTDWRTARERVFATPRTGMLAKY